jgi:preprotein translocase subunit SecD
VREGRSLQAAVEAGWGRARRTILASDTVSFLAALVLYILAIGSVRGFAFTLGLTTIVDVIVVFLFTKPVVTLLARTKFFGGGHKLSGFDAAHLGRSVAYAGRGRVRTPSGATPAREAAPAARQLTLAERRAERERAAGENAPPDAPDRVEQTTTSGRES